VPFILEKEARCLTRWTLYEAHNVQQRLSHFIQTVKLVTFIPNVLCSNQLQFQISAVPLGNCSRSYTKLCLEYFLSHRLQFIILKSPKYWTLKVWAANGSVQ